MRRGFGFTAVTDWEEGDDPFNGVGHVTTEGSRGGDSDVPASAEAAEDDLGCIPFVIGVCQDPTGHIDGPGKRLLRGREIIGIDDGQGLTGHRRVLEDMPEKVAVNEVIAA